MSAVYKAIAAVQGELAKTGIAKSNRNQQQGYQFRGIDQVYEALSPLLASNGLCILPRVMSRDVTERTTAKGGVLFYVVVDVEFDLVAAEDGSTHTIRTIGEAMDSGDKATNKAMSAAYKYAAIMAFAIPVEGDNDADATTHDVAPRVATSAPREVLEGPYSSMTALKAAYQQLDRNIRQSETLDDLDGLLELDSTKALIDQLKRYANGYVVGSDKLPAEHVPLNALIDQCRAHLVTVTEEAERQVGAYRAG